MYILIFILSFILFNIVFFLHEFGHYITSIKFGVKINEFSFGIGPRIFKIKKNESIYSLRAIPIGFSCSLEEGESTCKSFNSKNNFKKIVILLSSLFMDLVSSFFLSICASSLQSNISSTKIDGFFQNSNSDSHGKLKMGDEIISINKYKTHIDLDVLFSISISSENNFTFNILRNGEFIKIENVNFPTYNYKGKEFVKLDFILRKENKNFINVMIYSSTKVGSFIRIFFKGLSELITRKMSIKSFPDSIHMVTQVNQIENNNNFILLIVNLLHLAMIISISLLIINLIPISSLSTGMILFILIEKITNMKIKSNVKELINMISFAFIVFLSFVIIINDIMKIIRKI